MTTVSWDGLEELKAALRALPRELASDANYIVLSAVDGARMAIIEGYPTGPTGNLKKRVVISKIDLGPYGAGLMLKSAAPHAWLFEHGSQARHTARGFNRGSMPANHLFSRTVVRARRAMWHSLADLMRTKGLQVTEHAA